MIKNIAFLLLIIACNLCPIKSESANKIYYHDTTKYFKTFLWSRQMTGPFETLVSLGYIESNPDRFYAFNYPRLNRTNIGDNVLELYNDTIRLSIIKTKIDPKDQLSLSETEDYFRRSTGKEYFGVGVIWPDEKIAGISIEINKVKKILSTDSFDDLLAPNLYCNRHFVLKCQIYAYITDESEILLSMEGGEASGSYLTIFVFDKTGNILKRIAKRLSP